MTTKTFESIPMLSLLVPIVLIGAVSCAVARGDELPAVPGMQRSSTPNYIIYATSKEKIEAAREGIQLARRRFSDYVGADPPRIAVVIHDTLQQVNHFDPNAFHSRGIPVLPWFDWKSFSADIPRHLGFLPAIAVIAQSIETPGTVKIVVALPIGGKASPFSTGDVITSVSGKAVKTVAEVRDDLKPVNAGDAVELGILRNGKALKVSVKASPADAFPKPMIDVGGNTANAARRGNPLSHEVGHILLIAWLDEVLGKDASSAGSGPGYGYPSLPDWLDEGVATLCEPDVLQVRRRQMLRKTATLPIPLPKLLTMRHPLSEEGEDRTGDCQQVHVTAGFRKREGEDHAGSFYSESLVLSEYLAQQEGSGFIGKLARDLVGGSSFEDAIAGSQHLPHSVDALARNLEGWLARTGCWRGASDRITARVLPGRLVLHSEFRTEVIPIVRAKPQGLVLEALGRSIEVGCKLDGDEMVLDLPMVGEHHLVRSHDIPDELRLEPYTIAESKPVSSAERKKIETELHDLVAKDQEVRKRTIGRIVEKDAREELAACDHRSSQILKKIVCARGWIDGKRFSREAVENAWLLVHHSGDLRLQLTALPGILTARQSGDLDEGAVKLFRDRLIRRLGGPRWAAEAGILL